MAQHTLDYKNAPKYNTYKKRALEKWSNEIYITKEEFDFLTNQKCFYCDKEGPNGIDRIDNKKGYLYSNCVPACKHCNYVKGDLSLDDFNTWKLRFIDKQLRLMKCENA